MILRILVAALAVIWFCFYKVRDWSQVGQTFTELNLWYFVGSLAIFVVSQIIVGFRWWLLLRSQRIFIEFWSAVRLHFLGLFYNNFMPSSLGGDLIRAWYVTKHTNKKLEAALSVFVDRTIGLIGMLIIGVCCYFFFMWGKPLISTPSDNKNLFESLAEYRWIFVIVFIVLALSFCVMFSNRAGRGVLKKVWKNFYVHGKKLVQKLKEAVIIYCSSWLTILFALALTIFIQMLVITAFWILGLDLGITASPKYYYVFFPITWLIGALPISIGGIGVVEGCLTELFNRFANVAVETISALAICQRLVWTLASLPGLFVHLIGAHLPKDFFVDYEKTLN